MIPAVRLFTKEAHEISVPDREIWRYLGYGNSAPDEIMLREIEEVRLLFGQAVQYRACYAKTRIGRTAQGETVFPFGTVKSGALERNLAGCEEAWVFCATAGIAVDRMIARNAVIRTSRSVIMDAVATAALEAFCDALCDSFGQKELQRPRFSPGYGDLSVEYQEEVLRYLDARRKINVQLTEAGMMVPSKSVTAVAGIGKEACAMASGCRTCGQKDCAYRRKEA